MALQPYRQPTRAEVAGYRRLCILRPCPCLRKYIQLPYDAIGILLTQYNPVVDEAGVVLSAQGSPRWTSHASLAQPRVVQARPEDASRGLAHLLRIATLHQPLNSRTMNNSQFRRLLVETPKPQDDGKGKSPASATPRAVLGARKHSSIPMTP